MKEDCATLRYFARSLRRRGFRYSVLVFWFVFTVVTGISAPGLLSATSQDFVAPASSLSARADDMMGRYFQGQGKSTQFIVLVQSKDGSAILANNASRTFDTALFSALKTQPLVVVNSSYFSMVGIGFDPKTAEAAFVSRNANKTATFVQIVISTFITNQETFTFLTFLQDTLKKISEPGLNTGLLGAPEIVVDAENHAMADLERMDMIVLPVSFLVFGLLLQSFRLMLVPLASMGASVAGAFGVVTWIAQVTEIYTVTPSLMMSVLIAMAIDYALFLLTRYKEELGNGKTTEEAVEEMCATAGTTILISSLTLQASFLALLFFPVTVISSLGLGCAVALVLTMLINLTLVPAILLTFPNFFAAAGTGCIHRKPEPSTVNTSTMTLSLLNDEHISARTKGCWWYLARFTTLPYWRVAVVVVITGLIIPVAVQIQDLEVSDGLLQAIPRGSDVRSNFIAMSTLFGVGMLNPYKVLLLPKNGTNAFEPDFFNASGYALDYIASSPSLYKTNKTDFSAAMYANGNPVPWQVVYPCVNSSVAPVLPYNSSECVEIRYIVNTTFNEQRTAAFATIILSWDPLMTEGNQWLQNLRSLCDEVEKKFGVEMWVTGVGSNALDAIQAVYDLLPIMMGVTAAVVLLIVGVAFRTVMIPVRSVVTILLTLGWVYGSGVLTYQYGWLDWVGFDGIKSQGKAEWLVPIVSFPIIVGISLDYDIFLISRILELRDKGETTIDAIRMGIYKTGHIITTAGIIMAIAFSGLLFSSLPVCNQLSMYMVWAVLFDTFAVRTFLVPSLMAIFGEANWWPQKPPSTKGIIN